MGPGHRTTKRLHLVGRGERINEHNVGASVGRPPQRLAQRLGLAGVAAGDDDDATAPLVAAQWPRMRSQR